MSIRLRLALAFALAAAALFALGGWLFASGLSSAQLKTIDSQLTAQLAQAGRSLPAGDFLTQVIDPAGRVRSASTDAGNVALVTASQLSQARQGRIFVTRTVDEESTRIAAAPLGQCGPCVFGLPAIADQVERLAEGRGADTRLLRRWLGQVDGRGGCAHPDGAVRLVRSALRTFGPELPVPPGGGR